MDPQKFENWLVEKEGKKESTARQYSSAISQLSQHFTEYEHKLIDLYEILDIKELEEICNLYDVNGKYKEIGETGHATYRNAVKALLRFITGVPREKKSRIPRKKSPIASGEQIFSFDSKLLDEARSMSNQYELFYCLERYIRNLIVQVMMDTYGKNWWDTKVSPEIKKNVDLNLQREADTGFTPRSENKIDYTTFGELRQIIKDNWDSFSHKFTSFRAFNNKMIDLNVMRIPIAHCTPLVEDEIIRLRLLIKDWFRIIK